MHVVRPEVALWTDIHLNYKKEKNSTVQSYLKQMPETKSGD